MDQNERKWIEEAMELCKRASQQGLQMMLIRKQDANDEGDYIVTTDSGALTAAVKSLRDDDNGE